MTEKTEEVSAKPTEHRAVLIPILTIVIGMVVVINCSSWLDARRLPVAEDSQNELYLSDSTLKRLSLAFNGLVSDWYWMRALQYVGQRIINHGRQLDSLGELDLKLLAPLLDRSTTLDPQFTQPYEYGAIILPDVDLKEAIRITQKGIAANPTSWRLRQYLGYIYWQQGDFKMASQIYGEAASLPDAPPWLAAMQAQMLAQGGSNDTARQIYARIYQESDDPNVREMARKRLLQVRWFEEREAIRQAIAEYQAKNHSCPSSFRVMTSLSQDRRLRFDDTGSPVDPSGYPYQLIANGCDVALNEASEVPAK